MWAVKSDLKLNYSVIQKWYADYIKTFHTLDEEFNQNIDLKSDHTLRVCKEIIAIGESLQLNQEQLCIAEIIALLHDVGRFEQFTRYKTFVDIHSEDHALLSVKIIRKHCVLDNIDESLRELILCVIANHNKMEVPSDITDECKFYTQLLRDADKLDIWRVITDYYTDKNAVKNENIHLGLPDIPEISEEVCEDLLEGRFVKTVNLKSLNDFKLLQMDWIYDINFQHSFQLVKKRRYLKKIYNVLPHNKTINRIYAKIEEYLNEKC